MPFIKPILIDGALNLQAASLAINKGIKLVTLPLSFSAVKSLKLNSCIWEMCAKM